jgi:hypothetical protein
MIRAVRIGGTVAAYVWDYAGQMQLMRYFWDAAVALDGAVFALDEGQRFPICQPEPLRQLFQTAQLGTVKVHLIDVVTTFRDSKMQCMQQFHSLFSFLFHFIILTNI